MTFCNEFTVDYRLVKISIGAKFFDVHIGATLRVFGVADSCNNPQIICTIIHVEDYRYKKTINGVDNKLLNKLPSSSKFLIFVVLFVYLSSTAQLFFALM
jgi:hypothetical protein